MFRNAMSLIHGDVVLIGVRILDRRSPRQIITADLDVIVGKLAQLVVVETEELGFFRSAQVEAGDVVDDVGDDGGHDEGVAGGSDDVGDLDVHLTEIAIDPAAVDDAGVDAVKADDVVGAEERVEEETEYAGNSVFSEHVEGVVDSEEEFDWKEESGKIGFVRSLGESTYSWSHNCTRLQRRYQERSSPKG